LLPKILERDMHVFTCPYCHTLFKVGHLEWSALTCINESCGRDIYLDVEITLNQAFEAVFNKENTIEKVIEEIS